MQLKKDNERLIMTNISVTKNVLMMNWYLTATKVVLFLNKV
jgi:hypothetical protein